MVAPHAPSITAFRNLALAAGYRAVHTNARFWVPSADFWGWNSSTQRWKRIGTRSARQREGDWEAVRLPSGEALFEFCEFTEASADYIFFGVGNVYRNQARSSQNLESDLATEVLRRVKAQSRNAPWATDLEGTEVDGEAFIGVGINREIDLIQSSWEAAVAVLPKGGSEIQELLEHLNISSLVAAAIDQKAPAAKSSRLSDGNFGTWSRSQERSKAFNAVALRSWIDANRHRLFHALWNTEVIKKA